MKQAITPGDGRATIVDHAGIYPVSEPFPNGGDRLRRLWHGQKSAPGHNNSVPVKSIKQARQIAAYWQDHGIPQPYGVRNGTISFERDAS